MIEVAFADRLDAAHQLAERPDDDAREAERDDDREREGGDGDGADDEGRAPRLIARPGSGGLRRAEVFVADGAGRGDRLPEERVDLAVVALEPLGAGAVAEAIAGALVGADLVVEGEGDLVLFLGVEDEIELGPLVGDRSALARERLSARLSPVSQRRSASSSRSRALVTRRSSRQFESDAERVQSTTRATRANANALQAPEAIVVRTSSAPAAKKRWRSPIGFIRSSDQARP